jgi:hypothetical protein
MVVVEEKAEKTRAETIIIMLTFLTKTITKSNKMKVRPKLLLTMPSIINSKQLCGKRSIHHQLIILLTRRTLEFTVKVL